MEKIIDFAGRTAIILMIFAVINIIGRGVLGSIQPQYDDGSWWLGLVTGCLSISVLRWMFQR